MLSITATASVTASTSASVTFSGLVPVIAEIISLVLSISVGVTSSLIPVSSKVFIAISLILVIDKLVLFSMSLAVSKDKPPVSSISFVIVSVALLVSVIVISSLAILSIFSRDKPVSFWTCWTVSIFVPPVAFISPAMFTIAGDVGVSASISGKISSIVGSIIPGVVVSTSGAISGVTSIKPASSSTWFIKSGSVTPWFINACSAISKSDWVVVPTSSGISLGSCIPCGISCSGVKASTPASIAETTGSIATVVVPPISPAPKNSL